MTHASPRACELIFVDDVAVQRLVQVEPVALDERIPLLVLPWDLYPAYSSPSLSVHRGGRGECAGGGWVRVVETARVDWPHGRTLWSTLGRLNCRERSCARRARAVRGMSGSVGSRRGGCETSPPSRSEDVAALCAQWWRRGGVVDLMSRSLPWSL